MPTNPLESKPRVRRSEWLLFALVWLGYALLVRRFWFLADDAFISFRYARHWVEGEGLRYNLGGQPPSARCGFAPR